MLVKIERDEIIDLFKEICVSEMKKHSTSDQALKTAHRSLEEFFETRIDILFEE